MPATPSEVTRLLKVWCQGDASALERLAPLVESELRRIARQYLSKQRPGHTLQPTALVNEAYLRLIQWNAVEWQDRAHFYAVAAKMMRRVLVNHAIASRTQKHGRRISRSFGHFLAHRASRVGLCACLAVPGIARLEREERAEEIGSWH